MKRILSVLILLSIPSLMMLQIFQAYRYVTVREEMVAAESRQKDLLEKNRRLQAGIAVYDAPERIYGVAVDSLGLKNAAPEDVLQVRFPENPEESR